ncbi:MAG TPA: endonuclease/exonuclease/phosphatase family protein [Thermoanaerobaculia bacterium]|nr:endonuclease/exonuclease/phosphatase family protein [Thermoanaerobaculia bacterium]
MKGTGEDRAALAKGEGRGARPASPARSRARDWRRRRRPTAAIRAVVVVLQLVSFLVLWGCGGEDIAIHDVQGRGAESSRVGQEVTVEGVVTAVLDEGFFLQSLRADWSRASSEGLFVSTAGRNPDPGDVVRVNGTVAEYRRSERELSVTTLEAADAENSFELLERRALPEPVPLRALPTELPRALETWEALEGMLVEISGAQVVGPTDRFGEAVLLLDGNATRDLPRTPRGGLALVAPVADAPFPFRVVIDDALAPLPPMSVGARLEEPIMGVVDYRFGTYRLLPFATPVVAAAADRALPTTPEAPSSTLSLATFNLENLDLGDEPARFRRLAEVVVGALGSPDLVGLQEIQDDSGARDDGTVSSDGAHRRLIAAIAALDGPSYLFREVRPLDNRDGGAPGANIRTSLLVRKDRGIVPVDRPGEDPARATAVAFLDKAGRPAVSPSPGRLGLDDPAFRDTRKPLVVQLEIDGEPLFVIVCHLSSKRGDDLPFGAVQPPRRASERQRIDQARSIARFVSDLMTLDPAVRVVVLGDLNDFHFSKPLVELEAGGLTNALLALPPEQRYTYVHQGVSQALDHVLLSPSLLAAGTPEVIIPRVGSEQPAARRVSDHDPLLVRIPRPGRRAPGLDGIETSSPSAGGAPSGAQIADPQRSPR